ncbi:hypothetical protein B0A48_10934 [Cryoendolithus antarcticus]|uniref:BHLH domain-containing protein n=1 Tax=Cryoendolithus antarcticus TaxID=1507870 RepID=A0A1V8SYT8_9PEZI|nr:hypothetical protein B0A48_10934 [Cryoendolithus antarcticus]
MASQATQQQQGLPSITSLTNGLPPPTAQQRSPKDLPTGEQLRDSDNSTNSQGLHVRTLLNPDDSPPRNSIPNTPQSARIPNSAHSIGSQLPSINQGFQDNRHRGSVDYPGTLDSRRSSVDSRMHQTFNNLYINNPASPYESANTSQVSLAASLRRPNGGPMSPLSARSSMRGLPPTRQAPPIMPIVRGSGAPNPTAAKPTVGHAWAFPEEAIPEERHTGSDSGESSVGVSRTNSFAASSIRSSIFSTDSQMPHGQRRFDDDPTTHHHTMQHRAIASLQNETTPPGGIGNYSRTPELRVSHKLAERKRRSEMKDLFEDLNKAVPASGGAKASKWEILTKAIEYIDRCQRSERTIQDQLQRLQRDADYARDAHAQNEALKTELQVMHQQLRRLDANAPHVYGPYTQQLQGPPQPQTNGSISLPPLNPPGAPGPPPQTAYGNGVAPPAPAGAMQGVEYGGGYGR